MLDLEENWDSYGAKPIDRRIAYSAVDILQQIAPAGLPAPQIVPTAKGRLHADGIDLEFEVLSPVTLWVSFDDAVSGIEWEKALDYNLMPLVDVLKALTVRAGRTAQAA